MWGLFRWLLGLFRASPKPANLAPAPDPPKPSPPPKPLPPSPDPLIAWSPPPAWSSDPDRQPPVKEREPVIERSKRHFNTSEGVEPAPARQAEADHAALLDRLASPSDAARETAVAALARAGAAVVPALIGRLKHHHGNVRAAAAAALGRMGPPARDAAPALLVASLDVTDGVRSAARPALAAVDPAWPRHDGLAAVLPDVAGKLGDPNPQVVQAASLALIRVGDAAVPALAEALGDHGPPTRLDYRRLEAARTLGRMGAVARPAVPHLIRLLECERTFVCQAALEALALVGPASPELVPSLIDYLGHSFAAVRQAACATLGRMGDAAGPAVPALIQALGDPDESARRAAADALAQLGATAAPGLRLALRDRSGAVRLAKELALKQMPEAALRSFFAEIERWDGVVRDQVRQILRRVCPAEQQEPPAPPFALFGPRLGYGAEDDVGEMERYWQGVRHLIADSESFREAFHAAMQELAAAVVPRLIALTSRENWRERWQAIAELARFGALAAEALPELERLEHDPDERIRTVAGLAHTYIRRERFIGFG